MILKKKSAKIENHKSIIDSDYINIKVEEQNFSGNISLIKIHKVQKEWYLDEERRCILAPNFKWLEIYPNNENYCITTIFDEKDKITEFYIDITKEIGIEDDIPYQIDLFLDVVIIPDGRKFMLDEDELKQALDENLITKEDYKMIYKVAKRLIDNATTENINKLTEFSYKYLNILKNKN